MNEQLTNVAVANLRHHSAAFTERRERVRDREQPRSKTRIAASRESSAT